MTYQEKSMSHKRRHIWQQQINSPPFMDTLKLRNIVRGHLGCVNTVRFRGDLLVSGSDDQTIKVWNCADLMTEALADDNSTDEYRKGRLRNEDDFDCYMRNSTGSCRVLYDFEDDSNYGSDNFKSQHYAEVTLPHESVTTLHRHNIFDADFVPHNHNLIVSCGADGNICLNDLQNNRSSMFSFARATSGFSSTYFRSTPGIASQIAFFAPNTNIFLVAFGSGHITRYDVRDPIGTSVDMCMLFKSPKHIKRRNNIVGATCVGFSPTNDYLFAVGARDVSVRLYDMRLCDKDLCSFDMHSVLNLPKTSDLNKPGCRYFSKGLISAGTAGPFINAKEQARVSFRSGGGVGSQDNYEANISGLQWTRDGKSLLVNYCGNSQISADIYEFDVSPGLTTLEATKAFRGRENDATCAKRVELMCEDSLVISGGDCGSVYIWDRETTELLLRKQTDKCILNAISVHNSHQGMFACSGIDSTIKIWSFGRDSGDMLSRKRLSPGLRLAKEFCRFESNWAFPRDEEIQSLSIQQLAQNFSANQKVASLEGCLPLDETDRFLGVSERRMREDASLITVYDCCTRLQQGNALKREARESMSRGNCVHARKVFDVALQSLHFIAPSHALMLKQCELGIVLHMNLAECFLNLEKSRCALFSAARAVVHLRYVNSSTDEKSRTEQLLRCYRLCIRSLNQLKEWRLSRKMIVTARQLGAGDEVIGLEQERQLGRLQYLDRLRQRFGKKQEEEKEVEGNINLKLQELDLDDDMNEIELEDEELSGTWSEGGDLPRWVRSARYRVVQQDQIEDASEFGTVVRTERTIAVRIGSRIPLVSTTGFLMDSLSEGTLRTRNEPPQARHTTPNNTPHETITTTPVNEEAQDLVANVISVRATQQDTSRGDEAVDEPEIQDNISPYIVLAGTIPRFRFGDFQNSNIMRLFNQSGVVAELDPSNARDTIQASIQETANVIVEDLFYSLQNAEARSDRDDDPRHTTPTTEEDFRDETRRRETQQHLASGLSRIQTEIQRLRNNPIFESLQHQQSVTLEVAEFETELPFQTDLHSISVAQRLDSEDRPADQPPDPDKYRLEVKVRFSPFLFRETENYTRLNDVVRVILSPHHVIVEQKQGDHDEIEGRKFLLRFPHPIKCESADTRWNEQGLVLRIVTPIERFNPVSRGEE